MMYSFIIHRKKAQGSALILALFVMIVVGFLGLMAIKNQDKVSTHVVTSVMGTRTHMAAQSAIQISLSDFYASPAQDCNAIRASHHYSGAGLSQCKAEVSCTPIGTLDSQITVFQLVSKGTCTYGDTSLQRIIEVGIRNEI